MSSPASIKTVQGIAIHTLSNEALSVSMAPALGGRVVSIKDRVSGREWLDGWQPAAKRRLWPPTDPADFASGPGAGIDECLPTVLPCHYDGQPVPDHGELWNQATVVDPVLANTGVLACHWLLKSLPLRFERKISLGPREAHFHYELTNLSDKPTPFLWAWHALFTWRRGDQMHFAPEVTQCLTPEGLTLPWPQHAPGCDLSKARFRPGATPAAKVFVGPLDVGQAAIRASNGACLTLHWPTRSFPYAGIWITRGFWKGLHHWAIEPTNAPVDRLSDISPAHNPSLTFLNPRASQCWSLTVTLTPGTS